MVEGVSAKKLTYMIAYDPNLLLCSDVCLHRLCGLLHRLCWVKTENMAKPANLADVGVWAEHGKTINNNDISAIAITDPILIKL